MAVQDEFLATARRRFDLAAEEEKDLRRKFVSDLKFASPDGDEQWDPQVKMQREQAGRPAMSFPRCHTFVQQVSNEARQNKPQIKFAPRLDADKDTAEIYEGLARYIQYTSDAQVAYETAVEYSAGASFGYYRFLTDYVDDDSDDLELKVVPVLDPLTIYGVLVPACFNRRASFAFVVEDLPKEEYKQRYPKSDLASLSWPEAEKKADGWVSEESVRIAEYWYVTETPVKGKRRPERVVKFCKINGVEVLEGTETVWPGSTIPIVPVLGKQLIIEGKPHLYSVVRPQKSAQQMLNYAKSRIAETLAQAPVSPFIAPAGSIDGREAEWQNINTQPKAVIQYKPVDINGHPVPPPQRQTFEPPIQALSSFVMQEVDDMKATTGIFDASLGNQANETSGQAILRRAQQGNLNNLHFMDNLERSFKVAGKIIYELIPKIYDTEREITILGADEKEKIVLINKEHKDAAGNKQLYEMTSPKYSLVVTMGKAFSSKRAESFDTMSQVLQSAPGLLNVIGDLYFQNSDLAGADQIAERLKKTLPPQLQDDQNNPLPPQAQAAVAQAQQQVGMMQGELQKLTMEKQAKMWEAQGKMQAIAAQHQADMELENRKMEVQIAVAEIESKSQIAQERMQFVSDLWKQFHGDAHDVAKQAHQQAHERVMSAQQHAQAQEMAQTQAANQSALSAQNAQQAAVSQADGAGE